MSATSQEGFRGVSNQMRSPDFKDDASLTVQQGSCTKVTQGSVLQPRASLFLHEFRHESSDCFRPGQSLQSPTVPLKNKHNMLRFTYISPIPSRIHAPIWTCLHILLSGLRISGLSGALSSLGHGGGTRCKWMVHPLPLRPDSYFTCPKQKCRAIEEYPTLLHQAHERHLEGQASLQDSARAHTCSGLPLRSSEVGPEPATVLVKT